MPLTTQKSTRPISGPSGSQRVAQAAYNRAYQASMFARVTCYPPVGQVTCPKRIQRALESDKADTLRFVVVIESSCAFPKQCWEADIWHNIVGVEWSALPLEQHHGHIAPLMNGEESTYQYYRHVFFSELALPNHGGRAQFTVRFRPGPNGDWQWLNEQQHVGNGELVFAPRTAMQDYSGSIEIGVISAKDHFGVFFERLSSEIDVEPRKSESPGSSLWHLSGEVNPAQQEQSGHRSLILGIPSSMVRFQVLVAAANDFDVAMSSVMYEARKVVRPYSEDVASARVPTPVSPPGDDSVMVEKDDAQIQWLANWYDGLTYCTWNGLGQKLTEKKILKALETLKSYGIEVSNLIIDDNWQALDNEGEPQLKRGWKQFDANPDGFPRGLKQTINTIRRSNPTIEHIGVWHALCGYWGGIAPDSELATKYKTKEVKIRYPAASGPIGHASERESLLVIDPDDIQRFYNDFYSFLTSAGVDSVKTDAQFFLDLLADPEDRRRFIPAYQDAWSIASLRYLSTRVTSCMSLFPQAVFHSQLPTNKPIIPLRNSDDFFPEIPESHPWHVFCNAHNALFTRYLNVLPDWDMFQTSHPYATFHAAARCISGGPIYITDEPGKHNTSLLSEVTAPTVHGNTVILRPDLVGRTIDTYNGYHEGHVLRVGTYTGWARTGSGILGLFNISASPKSSLVSLLDFPGIHNDYNGQYVVRSHTSGKITDPMRPKDANSVVAVNLGPKGWEILTAYPVRSFTLPENKDRNEKQTHVAVLGLVGQMTGAAALTSSDVYIQTNGRLRIDVSLKALGTLGIYLSNLGQQNIAENLMITILEQPIPQKMVWMEEGENARVLSVDVLSAWKIMGLEAGWSNEVLIQIFVG
ncbi:hypothetical protein EYZ11_000787 [Aspergillus tanneri]|uniref:Uncharacterized protein n=1 Tax=Aspergillus tanneri TaxID=1220188 RepID=A0A4S3JWD7_9EURO|nr:hypothetical protein EYZ11_000787 [Aspergillus tanneri]